MGSSILAHRCRLSRAVLFLTLLVLPLGAQVPASVVEKTAHFTIEIEGEDKALGVEAVELGLLLEQAWKAFADTQHCEPQQTAPSQFNVRLCATRETWVAAVENTGVVLPTGLDWLYFLPERDTVFLYRQASPWLTRRLALHGTWQQIHYRAKAKNADLLNCWFVLGLAEQLSIHRWDGKTLELGARPRITMTDMPGQAARALANAQGLGAFTEANLGRPELSWALVSFLRTGGSGKYRARFDKLALGQTGSKLSGPEFAATLGKPEPIYAELMTWLAAVQEPMGVACGAWEDLDGRALQGSAPQDDYAFALVRAPCSQIQTRMPCGPENFGGLLLSFKDNQHYTFAVRNERGVIVQSCDGVELVTLGEYPSDPPKNGTLRLRARRLQERVTLFVEERETASFPLEGPQFGLAVERGSVRFLEATWK